MAESEFFLFFDGISSICEDQEQIEWWSSGSREYVCLCVCVCVVTVQQIDISPEP